MYTYKKEDFLIVIGHISVTFALLDFFVAGIIYKLKDGEEIDILNIKDETTLGQKLRRLKEFKDDNVNYPLSLNELKKILPKAIKINKERNRYAHDQWVFKDEKIIEGKISRLRIKRKNEFNINVFKIDEKMFSINDLKKFLNEIILIQKEFAMIYKKMPMINRDKLEKNKNS